MNFNKRSLLRGSIFSLAAGISLSALAKKNTPAASASALYGKTKVGDFDRTDPERAARYFQNCVRAGDVEGAVSCLDVNAIYITQAGKYVRGRDAIRVAVAKIAALKPDLQAKRSAIFLPSGDIASLVDEWSLKATLPTGQKLDLTGVSSDVLKRQANGVWTFLVDNPYGSAYLTV